MGSRNPTDIRQGCFLMLTACVRPSFSVIPESAQAFDLRVQFHQKIQSLRMTVKSSHSTRRDPIDPPVSALIRLTFVAGASPDARSARLRVSYLRTPPTVESVSVETTSARPQHHRSRTTENLSDAAGAAPLVDIDTTPVRDPCTANRRYPAPPPAMLSR